KSRLAVDPRKIRVFYLPLLTSPPTRAGAQLPAELRQCQYIFYPTQARPNKNLALLLKVFDALVARGHDLRLVLTCELQHEPKALRAYELMKSKDRVVFKPQVSDGMLIQLYQHAALLCFTSLAEGNFPPQIQEALSYDTPVVASNLGFITERIPADISQA